MECREEFAHPPIVEAIIDIQVTLSESVTLEHLASFQDGMKEEFPKKRDRIQWQGAIEFKPGELPNAVPTVARQEGYMFVSDDEKRVIQAKLGGFAYSYMGQYKNWQTFKSDAQKAWDTYRQLVSPISITRIGLRYVNRLEIPLPFSDFKEYILTVPEIAAGIPQAMSDFFMRLVIPDEETGATAIVTETIESSPHTTNKLPLIFDIDTFYTPDVSEYEGLWEKFDDLRNFKNRIFFTSITNKARGLFK
jgi:uncharacterized protein (TIGR04255 family)